MQNIQSRNETLHDRSVAKQNLRTRNPRIATFAPFLMEKDSPIKLSIWLSVVLNMEWGLC